MRRSGLKHLMASLVAGPLQWEKAQQFELRHSRRWLKDNFAPLWSQIEDARRSGRYWSGPMDLMRSDFFQGSETDWLEFASFIENRSCLEIGAGPCGALAIWWWVKRRVIIDPLILMYLAISLEMFNRSWYTDEIELIGTPAEQVEPRLLGTIDGAIICRNTLDHCADPGQVLRNIAQYASRGSLLLLWTDLWHTGGRDQGHRNITRDRSSFLTQISELGYHILRDFSDPDRSTVNFGCIAEKT